MPRPPDHYTHQQFETIESDFQGETVRCMHCKQWTGSIKTLNRKKDHLLKCVAYANWREAGHGQDLAPPNKYSKRDGASMNDADPYSSPYAQYTPNMVRNRALDLSKHFDEFWDDSSAQKCMRTRCKYCGFVRAKNTTRQYEHLQQCSEFLGSTEGQQALADGLLNMQPNTEAPPTDGSAGKRDIWRGGAPNPNLTFKNPGGRPRLGGGRPNLTPSRPGQPPKPTPSLINHLLAKNRVALEQSTQLQFLSHAGCGTLSNAALGQWLTQQGHMSRALCTFIGSLVGKIRLTETQNPSTDTSWRALDLLVSAVNNAKRELEFLRTTQYKYGLQHAADPPKPATKGFIDFFASVSSPAASLLEGLVALWAVEHLYCISWQYAGNFVQPAAPSSTSYTVPSYLQQSQYDIPSTYDEPQASSGPENTHINALHEALIPNWTSMGFSKFVDACKSIVDELANAQTTGNGAAELNSCEANFKQAVWLWKQLFPEVTGMGEEEELAEGPSQANGTGNGDDGPIEIPDDDEDDDDDDAERDEDAPAAESPYGGTGLGAVAAANRGV